MEIPQSHEGGSVWNNYREVKEFTGAKVAKKQYLYFNVKWKDFFNLFQILLKGVLR